MTILLGAVGLAITAGALVIGVVALTTLREIKDDAANAAKDKVTAMMNEGAGHKILAEMARRGELDDVLERVVVRTQDPEPEPDPDNGAEYAN